LIAGPVSYETIASFAALAFLLAPDERMALPSKANPRPNCNHVPGSGRAEKSSGISVGAGDDPKSTRLIGVETDANLLGGRDRSNGVAPNDGVENVNASPPWVRTGVEGHGDAIAVCAGILAAGVALGAIRRAGA
jgi:hypothetical protein